MIKSVVLASDVEVSIVCAAAHELSRQYPVQEQMRDFSIQADNAEEIKAHYGFKDNQEMFRSLMAVEVKDGVLFVKRTLNCPQTPDVRLSEQGMAKMLHEISGIPTGNTRNNRVFSLWEKLLSAFHKKPQRMPKLRIRIMLYHYDTQLNILLSSKGVLNALVLERDMKALNIVCNACQDSHIILNGKTDSLIVRLRPQNRGHIRLNGLNSKEVKIEQAGSGSLLLENIQANSLQALLKGWGNTLFNHGEVKNLLIKKENFAYCIVHTLKIGEFSAISQHGGGTMAVAKSSVFKMVSRMENPVQTLIKGSNVRQTV